MTADPQTPGDTETFRPPMEPTPWIWDYPAPIMPTVDLDPEAGQRRLPKFLAHKAQTETP